MTSFLDAIVCCRDVVEEDNKSGKIVKQAVAWTVNTLYAVWAKKAGTAAKFEALVKAQGAPEEILKIVHDQLAQCAVLRDVWAPIVKTVKMGRGNVPLDALGGE